MFFRIHAENCSLLLPGLLAWVKKKQNILKMFSVQTRKDIKHHRVSDSDSVKSYWAWLYDWDSTQYIGTLHVMS